MSKQIDYLAVVDDVKAREAAVRAIMAELEEQRLARLRRRAEAILSGRVAAARKAAREADPMFWRAEADRVGVTLVRDVWLDCPAPLDLAFRPGGRFSYSPDGVLFTPEGVSEALLVCSPVVLLGAGEGGSHRFAVGHGSNWREVVVSPPHRRMEPGEWARFALGVLVDAGLRLGDPVRPAGDGSPEFEPAELAAWWLLGVDVRRNAIVCDRRPLLRLGDVERAPLPSGSTDDKLRMSGALSRLPRGARR